MTNYKLICLIIKVKSKKRKVKNNSKFLYILPIVFWRIKDPKTASNQGFSIFIQFRANKSVNLFQLTHKAARHYN